MKSRRFKTRRRTSKTVRARVINVGATGDNDMKEQRQKCFCGGEKRRETTEEKKREERQLSNNNLVEPKELRDIAKKFNFFHLCLSCSFLVFN